MVPGAAIEESRYWSEGVSLAGETIVIEGLNAFQIDVLVRIELADGSRHSAILRPKSPSYTVPERESKWSVAVSYWQKGAVAEVGQRRSSCRGGRGFESLRARQCFHGPYRAHR